MLWCSDVLMQPLLFLHRYGECSSLTYNVTFENSTMLIGEWRRPTTYQSDSLPRKATFKHSLFLWFPVCFFCVCVFFTEKPFYLKEVYLTTGCSDCLVAYEEVISGKDTFTSLLLFSKKPPSRSYSVCQVSLLGFLFLVFFFRLNASPEIVPNSDIFISRQEKDCLTCCCGYA